MAKSKKGLLILIVSLFMIITMTIFYGCGDNKGGENCTTSGHGSIVTNTDNEGNVTYTAVADKWNVFSGWYDGVDKYSDRPTISVDSKTPDNLIAKFETSGSLSVDRILNASYHRYSDAIATGANYLNMSYDATVSVQNGWTYSEIEIERGGFISLNGEGFNDYSVVKKGDKTLISSYLVDDSENSMLYLDINGRKVAVEDFESIGKKIFQTPTISSSVWSLQNLLDEEMFSLIEGFIGFRNSVGFVKGTENAENQTKISFNIDNLLNELKNRLDSMSTPQLQEFKNLIETLTSHYQGILNKLPKITLELVVDYITVGGIEKVESVEIKMIFGEEFKFELEDNLIKIPACTISAQIANANFVLSENPNKIPSEIITLFPEAVHAINVHADGVLSFLKENVATLDLNVIDQYTIELDTDLNYNAFKDAIEDGDIEIGKVDWTNLGFLSFRIKLIENPNDKNQSSRHGGSTEYLNILIDTQKYGAKAFVYIDLYNPQTWSGFATSTYIINASYDIPELARLMPEIVDNLSDMATEHAVTSLDEEEGVANLLMQCVLSVLGLQFGEGDADEVLFNLFMSVAQKFAPNNPLIKDGMTYSEYGTTLAVEEIKNLIEQDFADANATLSNLGLHNNIFGKTTSHIAVQAKNVVYGSVEKNQQDEYIDGKGNGFTTEYNQNHKMIVGVAEDGNIGIESRIFTAQGIAQEVQSLDGVEVCVSKALFSDGSESSTFKNCQGNDAKIDMQIYSTKYEMLDENTAKITVYLSFSAGTLQGLLVNTYDIPYGLVEYSFIANLT